MLGQGALLGALPTQVWAGDSSAVTISILHTTDLHGHILPTSDYNDNPDLGGLARCASQIREWQRANANSILLDIGDVYQGTEVGLYIGVTSPQPRWYRPRRSNRAGHASLGCLGW